MNGHWNFGIPFDESEWYGFVYCITELSSNRRYIGKKVFRYKFKKPPLKGRKNNRIEYKDSGWRGYTGSSAELNANIKQYGMDNYSFEIISLHETLASLSYREVELQVQSDCLRNPQYFNKHIAAVKYIPPATTLKELQHRKPK